MTLRRQTLGKTERLKSRSAIERLFSRGSRSVASYPLRIVYHVDPSDDAPTVKAMFVVSKRYFRHAVDRNRVKRQMREAYRLSKDILLDRLTHHPSVAITMAFLWNAAEKQTTVEVIRKTKYLLSRIEQ